MQSFLRSITLFQLILASRELTAVPCSNFSVSPFSNLQRLLTAATPTPAPTRLQDNRPCSHASVHSQFSHSETVEILGHTPFPHLRACYTSNMSTKETTLNELGEMLAHVVERMATKDDFADLSTQIASIENDLKSIRRDLSELRDEVENISGFRKEIDHAFERIAAIEKHLGINHRIAA